MCCNKLKVIQTILLNYDAKQIGHYKNYINLYINNSLGEFVASFFNPYSVTNTWTLFQLTKIEYLFCLHIELPLVTDNIIINLIGYNFLLLYYIL